MKSLFHRRWRAEAACSKSILKLALAEVECLNSTCVTPAFDGSKRTITHALHETIKRQRQALPMDAAGCREVVANLKLHFPRFELCMKKAGYRAAWKEAEATIVAMGEVQVECETP